MTIWLRVVRAPSGVRLELEVEVVDRLHGREVRDLDALRHSLALFGTDLLAQDRVEEVEVGRLAAGGAGEERVELLGDAAEPGGDRGARGRGRARSRCSRCTSDHGRVVVEATAERGERLRKRYDVLGEDKSKPDRFGPLLTTAVLFFFVEMGDKTQLATVALAAEFHSVVLVTTRTTLGMLASDGLAVFLGERLARRVPMRWVRVVAASVFFAFGAVSAWAAARSTS